MAFNTVLVEQESSAIKASFKAFDIFLDNVISKKNLDLNLDEDFEKNVTNLPEMFQATDFSDGIYLSYESFLKNMPAKIAFSFSRGGIVRSIELEARISNDSLYSKNCWGFCKYGIPYINMGKYFSPIIKVDNSFEFYGKSNENWHTGSHFNRYKKNGVGSSDRMFISFNFDDPSSFQGIYIDFSGMFKRAVESEGLMPMRLNMESGKPY
jgi:hypothetical protein